MRWLVACAGLLLSGCQWMPGTAAHDVELGKQAISDVLRDPSSAQFRNVRRVAQEITIASPMKYAVCGEVNGKNLNGAYVGFTRFIADPKSRSARLDPKITATEAESERAEIECRRESERVKRGSGFPEHALFTCERARDLARDILEQVEFETIFEQRCQLEGQPQRASE